MYRLGTYCFDNNYRVIINLKSLLQIQQYVFNTVVILVNKTNLAFCICHFTLTIQKHYIYAKITYE